MKKILIAATLLVLLIVAACDTTKNSTAATPSAPPLPASNKPQKGEMIESNTQVAPPTYQKKALSKKSKSAPMEAVILQDSVVPKF